MNHLLMVDDEGPLAAADEKARLAAVENHKKWVEAAKVLGCKTVRVNLQGEGSAGREEGRFGGFAWAAGRVCGDDEDQYRRGEPRRRDIQRRVAGRAW